MNIVLDLDGTIIDSRMRLYNLFQYLVPESNLGFEEYWRLKRMKTSNEQILLHRFGYDERSVIEFRRGWMDLIETKSYLLLDRPFDGVRQSLAELQCRARLYICTARQFPARVLCQLSTLGLREFFEDVLVTEQVAGKDELISKNIHDLSATDWMIGDTGKDIQAGRRLNMKTCAVLSGFLNEDSLRGYTPDLIIDSIANIDKLKANFD